MRPKKTYSRRGKKHEETQAIRPQGFQPIREVSGPTLLHRSARGREVEGLQNGALLGAGALNHHRLKGLLLGVTSSEEGTAREEGTGAGPIGPMRASERAARATWCGVWRKIRHPGGAHGERSGSSEEYVSICEGLLNRKQPAPTANRSPVETCDRALIPNPPCNGDLLVEGAGTCPKWIIGSSESLELVTPWSVWDPF